MSPIIRQLSIRLVVVLLMITAEHVNVGVNANANANANAGYKSVTSLDQYGSSPQINNAQRASKLHSAPTVVAYTGSSSSSSSSSCTGTSLIVASLERKQPGIVPRNKCNIIGKSEDCIVATVGSGLAGDAAFVDRLLRRDVMHTWERYDAIPRCSRVAATASRIMLAFMGYDDEIRDGTVDVLLDDNGKRLSIGRPLAVNLIVAEIATRNSPMGSTTSGSGSGSGSGASVVELRCVDPSGVVSDEILGGGRALGRGAEKGTDLLRQRWRDDMDIADVEELCVGIIRDVTKHENSIPVSESDGDGDGTNQNENDCGYTIVVEVLGRDGYHVKRIPLME